MKAAEKNKIKCPDGKTLISSEERNTAIPLKAQGNKKPLTAGNKSFRLHNNMKFMKTLGRKKLGQQNRF